MGWLKKRFGEASTMSGLGVVFMVASAFAPQQYQMLVQGLAVALGLGGAVKADPGNK
jgi:hypothetical protein